MKRRVLVLTLLLAAPALAQLPAPPKPGPEHKQLEFFVGKWTSEGEIKPGPLGPGGKMTGSDDCELFAGGFHVVCQTHGKGPLGEMKALGVMGFDAEKKAYTWHGIDSSGSNDVATGELQGDTFTYASEGKMGGKVAKSRYVIKKTGADSYEFTWEMSLDGGPFATVGLGRNKRVK